MDSQLLCTRSPLLRSDAHVSVSGFLQTCNPPRRSFAARTGHLRVHAASASVVPELLQRTWQGLTQAHRQTHSQIAAVLLSAAFWAGPVTAADLVGTGECLLQNCKIPLVECLADNSCASNLVCLNRCNGLPDETECQLRCTQIHENPVVKKFNKCAVTEHQCVKTRYSKPTDPQGFGPPPKEALDENFQLEKYTGRWFITAGLNSAFDTFPCQDHYFSVPEPGRMDLKLNWRIPDDGKFIERSDTQHFVQDPEKAHLINDNNEFMNYRDDWYIIGSRPEAYLFVLYNGNNDAWRGYGGSNIYSRTQTLPEEYVPELRELAKRAGLNWDNFQRTDNACPTPDKVELE